MGNRSRVNTAATAVGGVANKPLERLRAERDWERICWEYEFDPVWGFSDPDCLARRRAEGMLPDPSTRKDFFWWFDAGTDELGEKKDAVGIGPTYEQEQEYLIDKEEAAKAEPISYDEAVSNRDWFRQQAVSLGRWREPAPEQIGDMEVMVRSAFREAVEAKYGRNTMWQVGSALVDVVGECLRPLSAAADWVVFGHLDDEHAAWERRQPDPDGDDGQPTTEDEEYRSLDLAFQSGECPRLTAIGWCQQCAEEAYSEEMEERYGNPEESVNASGTQVLSTDLLGWPWRSVAGELWNGLRDRANTARYLRLEVLIGRPVEDIMNAVRAELYEAAV